MIDLTTGTVRFAVVSFGGFLGMGNKLFAVPFEALLLDTDKKCFVLDTRGWLPVHPKSRIPPAILIPLQHHPRAQRRHPARW